MRFSFSLYRVTEAFIVICIFFATSILVGEQLRIYENSELAVAYGGGGVAAALITVSFWEAIHHITSRLDDIAEDATPKE